MEIQEETLSVETQLMQFLHSKSIAVVSTLSPAGLPTSATVYFVVDDDFNFYFITKTFSRKFKNLSTNPNASMVVGTDNEPATAQIEGKVERVVDHAIFMEKFRQFEEIFSHNSYVAPIFQMAPDDNNLVMFKLVPNWLRWLDLRAEKVDGGFVQIIPKA